jgi:hypothetical protein
MVSKPSVFPIWADQDQVDPVSLQNNVLTPPPEKQNFGWDRLEFPPRNWFNWLGRYTNRWLQYLAQQEAQAVVTDGAGEVMFDSVNGGLAYIYVVDTGNAANVYHGMVYLPPSSVGATFVDIKKVGINTPVISASGTVTISGGTGPYIAYGQTKTIPA